MLVVVLSLFVILSDQDRAGKCHDQGQDCVIITSCGDLLGILPLVSSWVGSAANSNWLLQVKTGNQKAQEQLVLSHCGFVKSLPMVCCAVVKGKIKQTKRELIYSLEKVIPICILKGYRSTKHSHWLKFTRKRFK